MMGSKVTWIRVRGHVGQCQRSCWSRSKVMWLKVSLKVVMLAGGLMLTSSCIFLTFRYDVLMLLFFWATFKCWLDAWLDIENHEEPGKYKYVPRQAWNKYEPTLLSEAFFAIAVIMAYCRLMYFLKISRSMGPILVGGFIHFFCPRVTIQCELRCIIFSLYVCHLIKSTRPKTKVTNVRMFHCTVSLRMWIKNP